MKNTVIAVSAISAALAGIPLHGAQSANTNLPAACQQGESKCSCPQEGVSSGCIKVNIDMGATTPWTGGRACALKVFADQNSPMIFTCDSLSAIVGGFTFKRLGNAVLSDGTTPAEVVFANSHGENIYFTFKNGESWGRPNPGVHGKMDERLMMVDAEGWAVTSDPVYYDLYVGDGTRMRFLATDMSGSLGKLVSMTDARGVTMAVEVMGVDIVYDSNGVRQFLTPSRLADVTQLADFKGYDVVVYPVQDVPQKDSATGLYALPATSPVQRLSIRTANGGKRAVVTLRSGEGGAERYVFDYVMDDWSLTKPSGVQDWKERYVEDSRAARLVEETRSTNGVRLARTEMNYKWESWGFAMTNRVEGFGGATNTTEWTFFTSGNGTGKIKTEKHQSGLLVQYQYDSENRVISETRSGPGMMTETTTYDYTPVDPSDPVLPVDTRPRTIVKTLNNIECERTYYVYSPLTNIVERVGTQGAAYGGTNVLRTVTAYYPVAGNNLRSGCVQSIRHEDGKLDLYDYELASNTWIRTITHLHEQSPAPVSGKTTRDITTTNARGEVVETRSEAFIDEIWYTIARNRMTYNSQGKRITSENLAGQVTTTAWDCCHKVSEVQPDGSTTTWDYDDEGRMIASSRLIPLDMTNVTWLTTCYKYDDLGRQIATWQTNYAAQVGLPVTRTRYDALGRVVARVDQLGNTTTTTYSSDSRTTTIINPNSSIRAVSRSADNEITSITGSAVTPEFHYSGITSDGTRWTKIVQGETAASPRFSKIYSNLIGQFVREEHSGFNGRPIVSARIYDGYGRVLSSISEGSPTVSYAYDAIGNLEATVSSIIVGNDSVSNEWRSVGAVKTFELVEGNVWSIETNVVGCSDASIDTLTSVSTCQCTGLTPSVIGHELIADYRGNVFETTRVRHASCDALHKSQPWARGESVVISRYGIPVQEMSVSAVTNRYAYDALGRLSCRFGGRGCEKRYLYDSCGLRVAVEDALGGRTSYSYDNLGRLVLVADPLGNQTRYEYDIRGRKVYEGGTRYPVRYSYDVFGNKTSMATYRDESFGPNACDITTWRYDESTGCMTNKIYSDGRGVSYYYMPDGKLSRRIWARGIVTDYAYDGWNNLTNTTYSDETPSISLAYDAMGRQTEAHDAAGVTTFLYDSFGSLTNETVIGVAGTNTIERFWDEYGRTAGYALNGTRQTTICYDPVTGRIESMLANGCETPFIWAYIPDSDLKSSLSYPNGLTASWQYDANNQLLQVCNSAPTCIISQYDYTYDAAGRRIARDHSGSAFVHADHIDYAYNIRSELTNAHATVDSSYCYSYKYDDIGNRIWSLESTNYVEYVANNLNQYTQISSLCCDSESLREEFAPQFDMDGNQTLIKTSTGVWSVMYNGENRPVRWERISPSSSTPNTSAPTLIFMSFDRLGRRVRYSEAQGDGIVSDTDFVYDGYLQVQAHSLIHGCSGRTIWDPTEPLLSRPIAWSGGEGVSYYLHDGDKNVSGVASAGLDKQSLYCYAPYGEMPTLNSCSQAIEAWRFSSEWHDESLGLVYYPYRHYIPRQGRWMGRDVSPVPSDNTYAFLGNRLGRTDCYGMYDEWVHYYLMYYMMRRMGYDEKRAKALAEGSAYPDADSLWKFVRFDAIHSLFIFKTIYQKTLHNLNGLENERLEKYQCCIKGLIKDIIGVSTMDSLEEDSLFKVGVLLHALGDTYAHFRKPSGEDGDEGRSSPVVVGHAKEGTAPDNPYYNMPRFKAFLKDVMELMPDDYSGDLANCVYKAMWPVKDYFPEERYLTYQEMIKKLYDNTFYIKFEEKTVERNSDRKSVVETLVEKLADCLEKTNK